MNWLVWFALSSLSVVAHFQGVTPPWWLLPITQFYCGLAWLATEKER